MELGKKVLVLVFLLVILVGVFAIQGDDFGKGYFSWLKMKMIGMGPELNLTEKDSGLDLTTIDTSNFSKRDEITEAEIIEEIESIKEISTPIEVKQVKPSSASAEATAGREELTGIGGPVPGTNEDVMSLEEIESEINRIQTEIEILTIEIQNLTNNNL